MQPNPVTEVTRAIIQSLHSEPVNKVGFFRTLLWEDERAQNAASRLIAKIDPESRDADFYNKYFSYCDAILESPNVGVTAGLAGMLQIAAGITTAVSPFTQANTFLGIGNGLLYGVLSAAVIPDGGGSGGSPDNASAQFVISTVSQFNTGANFAVGDVIFFTDSTTVPTNLSAPALSPAGRLQYSTITAVVPASGGAPLLNVTITVSEPMRYQRLTATYVVKAGAAAQTDMISTAGSGKVYKGCTVPVTESLVGGKAALTWQVDYTNAEAVGMQWTECLIGSKSGGLGATASALPSSSTLLAYSSFYPSPLIKGATTASQQYVLALG